MRTTPVAALKTLFALTDEQAMWRVQMHDDASAFAQLVARWEKPIQQLCERMTGDAHRAQDLTQEAFARVYARRKTYQRQAKFSTYLWRIALNLCYDELRRGQRWAFSSLDETGAEAAEALAESPATQPGPDGAVIQREHAALVRQALMELPEIYRSVVVLRHYHDLRFREIAEVLGLPEGTVKSRMAEALSQLGRLLQPTLGEGAQSISNPPHDQRHPERLCL